MSRIHIGVLALGSIVAPAGAADAGPTARFGMDFALSDTGAPNAHELGPAFAVGERLGPLLLEIDYAYLSFLDPETSDGGITASASILRADLFHSTNSYCFRGLACTRGTSLYGELGVAERFGQWHLDSNTVAPETNRQHEGHIGIGIELDNQIAPYRYGWQLGLRFAMAPNDPNSIACRGSTCSNNPMATTPSTERSVLVEWTFVVGQ